MNFVQTEIRQPNCLPVVVQVKSNPRLEKMAHEQTQYEQSIRDLEKQLHTLQIDAQRLDQAKTFSLEGAKQSVEIKNQIKALERQLAEQQSRKAAVEDQLQQWRYEFAIRQYRRAQLWRELTEARPGPVNDWSYTQMYAIGEKEKRTSGDVRRDLRDVIGWLLNFGGVDEELKAELQQLEAA